MAQAVKSFRKSKRNRDYHQIEDVDGKGIVEIAASNKSAIDAALAKVKAIAFPPTVEIGEEYEGKVKSIMPYGEFVEVIPGQDGLLHVSELDWKRVERVEDVLKEGESSSVVAVTRRPVRQVEPQSCCQNQKATLSAPNAHAASADADGATATETADHAGKNAAETRIKSLAQQFQTLSFIKYEIKSTHAAAKNHQAGYEP